MSSTPPPGVRVLLALFGLGRVERRDGALMTYLEDHGAREKP